MNHDVAALVRQARDDERTVDERTVDERHAAFCELVSRFEESARGWASQWLDEPAEAQDAVQDAFVTAWLELRQLRDPAAFGSWLKRLVATQCNRRRRKHRSTGLPCEPTAATTAEPLERKEQQKHLAAAMSTLPPAEHRVVALFYFLGRTLDEIAAILGVARGTVGKRLHSARIAIRRRIPRNVRAELLALRTALEGRFDEYVGEYRFEERPELPVRIEREGAELVSYANGQRSVLASIRDNALVTTAFDGEGRFQRDETGRVVQFVYYEFGARLGVAKRVGPATNATAAVSA